MMEAARTSETLVNFYQTRRRYNPEDSHLDGKTVLVVCLKTTVGESIDSQTFYFDLKHVKCGANAKVVYDALLNCLQKSGFSM
jgi:hypothetical protein